MVPPRPRKAPADAAASGPGRPKDLAKRAAILEAAKTLFTAQGFDSVSMDAIAAEAGVSKLTVYSHFGDKGALFAEAVRLHCDQGMPAALLDDRPHEPIVQRLTEIARAFYAMISAPEAVAGHRILCSPQVMETAIPQMFWEAGPRRMTERMRVLLDARVAAGDLDIPDTAIAASQFFTLLKGEPHMSLVFGCSCSSEPPMPAEAHVAACVDMFMRAYGARR